LSQVQSTSQASVAASSGRFQRIESDRINALGGAPFARESGQGDGTRGALVEQTAVDRDRLLDIECIDPVLDEDRTAVPDLQAPPSRTKRSR
jgi:hypothetical protein